MMENIPEEVYERVIDGYSQDVIQRLHALITLREAMRKQGMDIKNQLIDWHYENVRREFEKSKTRQD